MKKGRIVCGALACLLGAATVGSFASCTSSSGNVVIVKYAETGYGGGMMRHWKEEFEEWYKENHNGEEIRVVLEGSATMTADFLTHLQTGSNLGDVYIVLDTGWQKQAAAGKLACLDDVYNAPADESGMTILEFMNPTMRDYGKVDSPLSGEGYYAIPWTDGPCGIVYNKTMFEQYGWEIPETVDELMELCEQINEAKVPTGNTKQPYVKPFALFGSYGDYLGETWWLQYEGAENFQKFFTYETVVDASGSQNPVGYLQQGRVEALRAFEYLFYAREADEYHSKVGKKNMTMGVSTHTGAQQDFGNQYAAMIVEGAHFENEAATYLDGSFEYAMMPTPYVDGAQTDEDGEYKQVLASQAGDFMAVPAEANNVEGAKEFLKYINSRAGCESFTRSTKGAMRPFQYNASDVEDVKASDFMKSCWDIYENSEVVYHYSTSPMQWSNKLGKWPSISGVYDAILQGNHFIMDENENRDYSVDQAVNICQKCYNYAYTEWDAIYSEIA